ncbi:MAG: methyltransferase domain-containing protein [Gammaproteobacteria bacterium]
MTEEIASPTSARSTERRRCFDFRDFSLLDDSNNARYLIDSMDRMHSLPEIERIKSSAMKLLDLKPGQTVLECGCGLGQDAEALGKIVGESGQVEAVDSSELMLEIARQRSTQSHVRYSHANADSLKYRNNTFSAVYSDRLLVSQRKRSDVLSEMKRVLAPKGKIVVTDVDLGSAIMFPYLDNLTDKLLDRLSNIVENPYTGRELPYLFNQFGFKNIKVFSNAYVIRDYGLVSTMIDFDWMIDDLCHLGIYDKVEQQEIKERLKISSQTNNFVYSIILFTVVGEKPE